MFFMGLNKKRKEFKMAALIEGKHLRTTVLIMMRVQMQEVVSGKTWLRREEGKERRWA